MVYEETSALLVGERLDTFTRALMRRKPVVHGSFPPSWRNSERAAVERVRQLLHACYADEFSLGELAEVARLPQPRFLREFRCQLGIPPHAYQIHLRVDSAKLLIARGMPLVEVAATCGFFDQSHLHRHFRRIVGTSPGRYRQACA
jgi:transcriptional regulator GlxA family with amidase domain